MSPELYPVIIGIAAFFGGSIVQHLVANFFNKKNEAEHENDTALKNDVHKLLKATEKINMNLAAYQERTNSLFKLFENQASRIDKLTDQILELHKKK